MRLIGVLLLLALSNDGMAEESIAELKDQLTQLRQYADRLEKKIDQVEARQRGVQPAPSIQNDESNKIDAKIAVVGSQASDKEPQSGGDAVAATGQVPLVDLSTREYASVAIGEESHVLSNPWWENIEIHGFGAAGYYDTGSAGTRDFGGFEIKESSLFVTADVWEDIALFLEIQANRLDKDDDLFIRTGEAYVRIDNIQLGESFSFGSKIGRFDIPFGEEYLWQDAIDNPLITNSAAYPYGWDEGVLVFSKYRGLNWILAVSDGTDARSFEENSDKAINLKLYGNPFDTLYLSASYMHNGDASKSAIEFGGSHFQPVGASDQSSRGISASNQVDADLFQLDAKYRFAAGSFESYIALAAGAASQNDDDSTFDREIFWFSVEPLVNFNNTWYAVARYSEIGTYNADEGYHFDGKIFAGGNRAFGFDTMRFRRLALGLGWRPNPRMRAKLEIGQDWFGLIRGASLAAKNRNRNFFGIEVAVGF